jgi:hypothetical protein
VTAFWVCVHPFSKETAEPLLDSGVVSHREAMIQTCGYTSSIARVP